ncbi:hypothetical protein PC116_g25164 [Phytophthora cactorum]|nr:hypothetical protein C6341_g17670 [Phytophthora cactorum]KAG4226433.1 hypothetical protein PC116_g25164 [Phytophthora cactorum]
MTNVRLEKAQPNLPTGEGEAELPTGKGASSQGVVSNATVNAELVMDAGAPAVNAANSEVTSSDNDNPCTNREGYSVKRRGEEREAEDACQWVDAVRRDVRRAEPDEAMTRLGEGRPQRPPNVKEPRAATTDEAVKYISAIAGLSTTTIEVPGVLKCVKLDSYTRYTIADTDWMLYGDRVMCEAPVDYVEGIGGFLLDVVGVWQFELRSVFDEVIQIDACIVDGCTDEFPLGVDFMQAKGATIDFDRNKVRYRAAKQIVVIPFRTDTSSGGARIAAVRLTKKAALSASTVTPVKISIASMDGECSIFVPTNSTGAIMLAAKMGDLGAVHCVSRAWVPAINAKVDEVRLSSKKALGERVPLDDAMEALGTKGLLQ